MGGPELQPGGYVRAVRRAAIVLTLFSACGSTEPPLGEAERTAREFLRAFASGDHGRASTLATGDVLQGVEVQRRLRERERGERPAEVALFEKMARERPPRVELRPARRRGEIAEVRAVVTARGPSGDERARYELLLVWRQERWLVYQWERR